MKKLVAVVVIAVLFFSTSHLALAHAVPLACLPRFGINLTTPPTELICQFNEPLQPSSISMTVANASGERVDKNDTHFYQNDDHTLVVSLDVTKMTQGIYTANWQVINTIDLGMTSGTFQFGLNTVVPPTPTAVLPSLPSTSAPAQTSNTAATDLISRFLIGVGVAILLAIGVLFWRLRTGTKPEPLEDVVSQDE